MPSPSVEIGMVRAALSLHGVATPSPSTAALASQVRDVLESLRATLTSLGDGEWLVSAASDPVPSSACHRMPVSLHGVPVGWLFATRSSPKVPPEVVGHLVELGRQILELHVERAVLLQRMRRLRSAAGEQKTAMRLSAHEMSNLLTPLRMDQELAQSIRGSSMDARERAAADRFDRRLRSLERLVDEILHKDSVVGVQSGRSRRFNLAEAVRDAVGGYVELARQRGLRLRWEVPRAVWIVADADRVSQVLHNLLSNAIKFSPADSEVHVRVVDGRETVILEVQDQGVGLARAQLQAIREGRQPRTVAAPGHGMGLYITRRIVEAHGGTFRARSQGKGRGSAFTVVLPKGGPQRSRPRPGRGKRVRSRETHAGVK